MVAEGGGKGAGGPPKRGSWCALGGGPEVAFERVRAAARRLEEAYRVANFGRALGNSSAQAEERKAGLANGDGGHGVQQFRTTRKQVYELHAYETDPKPRIFE